MCIIWLSPAGAHGAHTKIGASGRGQCGTLEYFSENMRPKSVHPWVGVEHTGSMARQRKCKTVRYTLGKTLASDVQLLWKCGPIPHKLFCCNDLFFSFKAVHFIILFCAHIFNMLKQWANILRTTYSHYQRTPDLTPLRIPLVS